MPTAQISQAIATNCPSSRFVIVDTAGVPAETMSVPREFLAPLEED